MATSGAVGAGLLITPVGHAATACVPTVDRPSLVVADAPAVFGGTITVTGAGFCHPADGGSKVALKIDEGAFSRLDDAVHPNRTIWFVVEASATDGTFTVEMPLPNGTLGTSVPAFTEGTHTLRGLTGSIKPDDEVRTVKSNDFTVGEHRPSVPAEVVGEDDLEDDTRDAFSVAVGATMRLTLPGGVRGDWVYPTLMLDDGSPSSPWGTWFQLADGGVLELPVKELGVSGRHRVVLQNGNAGKVDELLGWSWVTLPLAAPDVEPPAEEPGKNPGKTPGKTPGDEPGEKPGKKPGKKTPDEKPGKKTDAPGDENPTPAPAPAPVPPVAPPVAVPAVPVALPAAVPASDVVAAVGPAAVPVPAVRPATLPAVYRGWASMPVDAELPSELDGDTLVVQLGANQAEAYVHLLDKSGAQAAAGWVAANSQGMALLDLRDLADGGYRFSFQTAAGLPIGWTALDLQGGGSEGLRSVNDSSSIAGITERDLWLGGIGLTLLVGVGVGAVVTRPRHVQGGN